MKESKDIMGATSPVTTEEKKTSEKIVKNSFQDLRTIDVTENIDKKGKFSYLSWSCALDELLQRDENSEWDYPEMTIYKDETVMVYCNVKAFGRMRKAQLPVMDNYNKPIVNPNSFQINTALQRCLAKGIAMHGIGLYIYKGEDLPDVEPMKKHELEEAIKAMLSKTKYSEENFVSFMRTEQPKLQAKELVDMSHEVLTWVHDNFKKLITKMEALEKGSK